MLQANSITVDRRRRTILSQASLALEQGRVLSLLGANGAGKSTFLSVLASELRLDAPRHRPDAVTLNGIPLTGPGAAALARPRPVLDRKRHVCTPVTNAPLVCRLL